MTVSFVEMLLCHWHELGYMHQPHCLRYLRHYMMRTILCVHFPCKHLSELELRKQQKYLLIIYGLLGGVPHIRIKVPASTSLFFYYISVGTITS